jgi:hypothetical protein
MRALPENEVVEMPPHLIVEAHSKSGFWDRCISGVHFILIIFTCGRTKRGEHVLN